MPLLTTLLDSVRQLDIVKFALTLAKISFHPIFAVVGKHTNFFMSGQAASRPYEKSPLVFLTKGRVDVIPPFFTTTSQ